MFVEPSSFDDLKPSHVPDPLLERIEKQKGPNRPGRFGLAWAIANLRLSLGGLRALPSRPLACLADLISGIVADEVTRLISTPRS